MPRKCRRIVGSLDAVAAHFGAQQRTVSTWFRQGCPRRPNPTRGRSFFYDLDEIGAWLKAREPDGQDPLLAGPASPALEEYRRARAGLAVLELQQRQGNLVDRAVIHERLTRIAGRLRQSGETLQRRYGPEAQQILDDALDDVGRELDALGGNGDGRVS